MNALSLFSGIGGLDLAAEMVGIKTAAFCEIEPFPVEVLKKRFPGVPIFNDVKTLTKESFIEVMEKEDKYANAVESYEGGKSIQQIADEYNKAVTFKGGDAHEKAEKDNTRGTIDIIFGGFP